MAQVGHAGLACWPTPQQASASSADTCGMLSWPELPSPSLSNLQHHTLSPLLQSHFSRLGDKLPRPDVCKPRNALSSLMDPAPLVKSAGMCWMDWDPSKMLNRPALGCLPLTACESRQPCLKPQRCWHPACNYLSPPPSRPERKQ